MPRVKIIQVINNYDDAYDATQTDVAHLAGWEDISDADMGYLKQWIHSKNQGRYGSGPHYALLMIPDEPISAIKSVQEVVDNFKIEAEKEEAKQKAARVRAEATKVERKRKQFEKLKQELGIDNEESK
jgi:hypothetical protein